MATERDIAIGFLARVLPSQGPYSYRYRVGKKFMKAEWADTSTQLWDKMSQHGDVDCFYSTASFTDKADDGKGHAAPDAAHVHAKRAFYLDLDGYKTQSEAIRAVIKFCQALTLPWPGFVLSGHGVHAYWPLDSDISPAVWLRYASGLKLACKDKDLLADGAVTADPARILRCPGTFNCKKEPKTEVTIHDVFFTLGPYALDEFAPLLSYAPEVKGLPETPLAFSGSAVLNDQTLAYYSSALDTIPNDDAVPYDKWLKIGMAIFELGWRDVGRQLWLDWSCKADKHTDEEFDKAWAGFPKYRETHMDNLVTPGTLIHYAEEAGWQPAKGETPAPSAPAEFVPPPELLGKVANGDPYPLYQAQVLHTGPEKNDKGCFVQKSYRNACWGLAMCGVRGRYDIFTGQYEVMLPGGDWERKSSAVSIKARDLIMSVCNMSDPGKVCTDDALDKLCEVVGSYHSVRNYLVGGGLAPWDGNPRLQTWLTYYLGASDTPLNRFYGAATLVAAVRRIIREEPTPFDHMLVLEGTQGVGKSTAVQILGGEWYKNRAINWQDSREQVEVFRGCWFYEWAELQGHGKIEAERVKTALSTPADEGRLAYRRDPVKFTRSTILIGTTNDVENYLTDQTGTRRYWCVECGDEKFKLDDLRRDRDQLFAEALVLEKTFGAYLDTPAELWEEEREAGASRTTVPYLADPLSQLAATYHDSGKEYITMFEIKSSSWMGGVHQDPWLDRKITHAMKYLGWTREKGARVDSRGVHSRRFWRPV